MSSKKEYAVPTYDEPRVAEFNSAYQRRIGINLRGMSPEFDHSSEVVTLDLPELPIPEGCFNDFISAMKGAGLRPFDIECAIEEMLDNLKLMQIGRMLVERRQR